METARRYGWFVLPLAGALTLLSGAQITASEEGSRACSQRRDEGREPACSTPRVRHFLSEQRHELLAGIREVHQEVRSSRNELQRELRELSRTFRSELRDLSRSVRESIRSIVRELRPQLRAALDEIRATVD